MAELKIITVLKCIFVNKKGIMGKLEELKDQLKSKKAGLERLNSYSITGFSCETIKKQIERIEIEIRELENEICHKTILNAIYFAPIKKDFPEGGRPFGVPGGTFRDNPKSLNTFNHHIVTTKDDPKPKKIKVIDRTKKTIVFVEEITGRRSDRMFISDFLANYTIHESFDYN